MDHFYFDHNASTPVSEEVLEAFIPLLRDVYGNASSIHRAGQEARKRLEQARERVAAFIGCQANEVVFTSGGTESNNLAILGAVRRSRRARKHVITSAIEHPAVLNACMQLEREGVEVTYAPVNGDGVVSPDDVRAALRPDTVLISIMHVNNEVGSIQPIPELAAVAQEAGALFHSDGIQAAGKIPISMLTPGIDLYSVSGHKFGDPKGAGALYVRQGVELLPLQFGGRHERERRPGTHNVPGAVALGLAADWTRDHLRPEISRLAALRDRLEQGILARVPDAAVNGAGAMRVANTTNIRFDGVDAEAALIALDLRGFAVSTGSACSSGAVKPSHVLTAMGLNRDQAKASVRFSLGWTNTEEQVDRLIDAVEDSVKHLRRLAPTTAFHA